VWKEADNMNAPMDTFEFPGPDTTNSIAGTDLQSAAQKFSRYDYAILKHVWALNLRSILLLDHQQSYLTTAGKLNELINSEKYPHFYEDRIDHVEREKNRRDGYSKYFVSYLFCSGLFLEDLSHDKPETPMIIQFRENRKNNFFYCLVRPWDKRWTENRLLAGGAKKLP
jgi:hypothetical protein